MGGIVHNKYQELKDKPEKTYEISNYTTHRNSLSISSIGLILDAD